MSLALLAASFASDSRLALGSVGLLVLAWPIFRWARKPRSLSLEGGVPDSEPWAKG